MRSVAFVAHDEKVATWRTVWPARELKKRGYKVGVWGVRKLPPPLQEPEEDCSYVFHVINKAWNVEGRIWTLVDLAKQAKERISGGRFIVSVDDDWTKMLHIQPRPIDPLARAVHSQIPELVQMADRVIVATPHLAEVFGRWARDVVVVENYLPEWVLDLSPAEKMDRVAWMGEMYIHGMDWNLLQPYARDLPPLYLIGSGEYAGEVIRGWGAEDVVTTPPILDQRKLYREMGRGVAAIIPLADTAFNRGKSWSKPMEFLARGVVPIASEHREYERLDTRTGGVPRTEDPAALVELVADAWDNRKVMVEEGELMPRRLRDAGMTMEQTGGDQWEAALA